MGVCFELNTMYPNLPHFRGPCGDIKNNQGSSIGRCSEPERASHHMNLMECRDTISVHNIQLLGSHNRGCPEN